MRVIVIEGHSGTGKTTTGGQLCVELRRRGLNVVYIPEHGRYLNPMLGQWVRHHATPNERRRKEDFIWLAVERQRMDYLMRARARGVDAAVVDTSLLSVVAYELGKYRLDRQALDKALLRAVASYLEDTEERPAVLWAFLHAPCETILERLASRGGARDVLISPQVISALNEFRRRFASGWLTGHSYANWESPVSPQALANWMLSAQSSCSAQYDRTALLSTIRTLLDMELQ